MIRSLVTRRTGSAVAVVFAFALASASVAWGCASIQPKFTGSEGQTSSGPAGSQVTVTGSNFNPGPVDVRWNSKTGALLAQPMGPNFSVAVKIPDTATVGAHYILAVPTTGSTATMPFEVTRAPTSSPEGSAPNNTGSTTSGGSPEDSDTSNSTQQTTGTGDSNATSGGNTSGQSNTGSTATESASGSSASGSTGSEAAPAVANPATTAAKGSATTGSGSAAATPAAQRPAPTASANPAVVNTPAGQAVFGGSAATATGNDTPSAATVSGDTWSGFGATTKPSLLADGAATTSSAPGSAPAVGIGLLGAGLVALLAGFGVAESARKRALAGTVAR